MPEPQETSDITKVLGLLGEIRGTLDKLNSAPSTAPVVPEAVRGVENQATHAAVRREIMSLGDMYELRKELQKLSARELSAIFLRQLHRDDTGIPINAWASAGGSQVTQQLQNSPEIRKALDSTGASALIRQDLEPVLQELYVKMFPAWDRFTKEPANGLVHAFNQITSFGDAKFLSELGTVTDDVSTYVRQTTNVAILATRRGISLKSQFAVLAGGAGYNPEALELQGGLRAMAHRMQKTIFEGQSTASGADGSNELGLAYDANAFTGLRSILNTSRVQNADETIATPDDIRAALDRACEQIQQAGGVSVNLIYTHPHEKVTFDLQQDKNIRYMNSFVDVAPGIVTNAVNTVFGPVPILSVPGDSISSYLSPNYSVGNPVRDMYLLDEGTVTLPYLGSEGPTVLDIPIGISGQLTHQYIIFGMWGLAVKAIPFSNKVRIRF